MLTLQQSVDMFIPACIHPEELEFFRYHIRFWSKAQSTLCTLTHRLNHLLWFPSLLDANSTHRTLKEAEIIQWSLMFANTICPSELKFKSILSHQHTLLFGLHYLLQSLHYWFHFASRFVPWLIHKELLTETIIIITTVITTTLYFWDDDWGLWGFVVFVRHARFYLRPVTPKPRIQPGAKRCLWCPPGYHTAAVSSVFEQHFCRDILRLSMTCNRGDTWTEKHYRQKRIFVRVTQQSAKCTTHLFAKTWCLWSQWSAGSLTCPGCGATGLAQNQQHQTGGQPEWGLMRLKPHQRLAYLSSLRRTCATVWWELKLLQNSSSSCNYFLLSHK